MRPWTIGHRGARGLRPENTLAAFDRALELGVDALELDVGVSRDGEVVVTHDRAVSGVKCRGAHVGRLVHDLTLAELRSLDCGGRRPPRPEDDPFRATQLPVPGERMPTLGEVYELVARRGADVQVFVELKLDPTRPDETAAPEEFVECVLAVVAGHEAEARTTLQSLDWRVLADARRRKPGIRLAALADAGKSFNPAWTAGLDLGPDAFDGPLADAALRLGADVVSPIVDRVTPGLLGRADALGLDVVVWTVNSESAMRSLVGAGLKGIVTDYPDLLLAVLEDRVIAEAA